MSQEQRIDLAPKQLGLLKKIIKQHIPNKTVWAYGSRVTWRANEVSDIDLTVFDCTHSQIDELKETLVESNLLISVDVMSWKEIPDNFKMNIKKQYVVLQEKKKLKGWREVKLGDVAEVQNGYAFKAKDFSDQGMCVIKIKNIASGKITLKDIGFYDGDISKLDNFIIQKGDVLVSMTGSHISQISSAVGKISIYDLEDKALLNQRVGSIKPKSTIDRKYLGYLLIQPSVQLFWGYRAGGSANQANISPSIIKSYAINLPPLPEQKAIAEVLSSLDDKIDLLHRQNTTLEDISQTLFRQWFGKYKVGDELPNGWRVGKLGEMVDISSGKSLEMSKHNPNGKYPILGANGEIGRTSNYLLDEKVIFTGRVGTLGNIFISATKVWLSDNTLIIKPIDSHFYYVYYALKNMSLKNLNVGSTQPLIRQSDLKNIELLLPENNILYEFEQQMDNFFIKNLKNKKKIKTLENLRNILLPKLMSGEVRVKE